MRSAETDDTQLERAFAAAFGWEREVELLGLGARFATWKAEIRSWLPRALQNAMEKASVKCAAHDLGQLGRLLSLERMAQLLGVRLAGEDGIQRYLRCARFEARLRDRPSPRGRGRRGVGVPPSRLRREDRA